MQQLQQGKKISSKRVNEDKYLQLFEFIMFDPLYREMSDKAKILYSFLRNKVPFFERQTEAYQMGIEGTKSYLDDDGNIFILADNTELMYLLNCSEPTLIKTKKELAKYGLLYEEQSKHAANRIYVLLPSELSPEWSHIDEINKLRKQREEERKLKNEKLKEKKSANKKGKINDLKKLSHGEIDDNPSFSTNNDLKNFSHDDLNNLSEKELNVLNLEPNLEEDEEENGQSNLVNFLISEGHNVNDAIIFENKVNALCLTGYTNDQVLKAIELTSLDCQNERLSIGEPYSWAAGKLQRMLNRKLKTLAEKAKRNSDTKRKGKVTRNESEQEKPMDKVEWLEKMVNMRDTEGSVDKMSPKEKKEYFKKCEALREKIEALS